MKIENVEVWGLERSRNAAGLSHGCYEVPSCIDSLSHAKSGSGHDCYLKGVVVAATVTASQAFWLQFGRYHFHDIVSSSSKMNSILDMEPTFRPETDKSVIDAFLSIRDSARRLIAEQPENRQAATVALSMSCPMGLELTAEIRTNFLQLKTILKQRSNHKFEEWRVFCDWARELGVPEGR